MPERAMVRGENAKARSLSAEEPQADWFTRRRKERQEKSQPENFARNARFPEVALGRRKKRGGLARRT